MKYYKIICWNECPFCLRAKMEMIDRSLPFEYCSVDHSSEMLKYYKSIYNHKTVPMIVEVDEFTRKEKFIGGYTDLIKYFAEKDIEREVCSTDRDC
jgi:glutaredoxin